MKKRFAFAAMMLTSLAACGAETGATVDPMSCGKSPWGAGYMGDCPRAAGPYLNGAAAIARGDWQAATEYLQVAVARGARDPHVRERLFRAALYAEKHDVLLQQAEKLAADGLKNPSALVILAAKKAMQNDVQGAIKTLEQVDVNDGTPMAEYVRYLRVFLMADTALDGEKPGDQFMRVMNDAMYQPSEMPGYPPDDLEALVVFTGLYVLPHDPFILMRAADYHKITGEYEKAAAFLERVSPDAEGYIFFQADAARILEDAGKNDEAAAKWRKIGQYLQARIDKGHTLDEQEDVLHTYALEVTRNGLTKSQTKGIIGPSLTPQ